MAYDEGSFLEGVIAGAGAGATAGTVVATPGIGTAIGAIGGALVGGLLKIRIFQALIVIFGLFAFSYFADLPPWLWIVVMIVVGLWFLRGK